MWEFNAAFDAIFLNDAVRTAEPQHCESLLELRRVPDFAVLCLQRFASDLVTVDLNDSLYCLTLLFLICDWLTTWVQVSEVG